METNSWPKEDRDCAEMREAPGKCVSTSHAPTGNALGAVSWAAGGDQGGMQCLNALPLLQTADL